jgi:hypothetical protein
MSVVSGTAYGMRASRILPFARTSRWAIVAVGTRKARAISSVSRPPSVRRVRATCASGASAGWQQVKIRRRRSSGISPGSRGAGAAALASVTASASSFEISRACRRRRSMALCRAVRISQARGTGGTPVAGHWSTAAAKASWVASSARSKSRTSRIRVATIRPQSER